MDLNDFFHDHPQAALAFSGGVDSAYLLYAAKKAGARVKAYYVKTAFQPDFEYKDACRLAQEVKAELQVIELDILKDTTITANPSDRCYHCKKQILAAILKEAKKDGFSLLIDGTNASDEVYDRPGMRALSEWKVRSPLRECGLTKAQIRLLSKEAGLFTHDKPAYACLATRIPTGTVITLSALETTQAAEAFLSALGFSDFRVRYLGSAAKIQLRESQLSLFLQHRPRILEKLKPHYSAVLLDLEVRHE